MKSSIKGFVSKFDQICHETADLVTFTEEILSGKLHFFVQCNLKDGKPFSDQINMNRFDSILARRD